jgi:hypothetical protein
MHSNFYIIEKIYYYTSNNIFKWDLIQDTYYIIKYVSIVHITKNKYLSLILIIQKKGKIIDYNNVELNINYITEKNSLNIKKILSQNNPIILDIYDII